MTQILTLATQLIALRTDSGQRAALDAAFTLALKAVPGYQVERFERNGVQSALVYSGPQRPARFKVILNCHLDVIPGKPEQYTPIIEGDRLYGVGAMDMKANLATAVLVFAELAHQVPYALGLQLVTDEQTGGFDGTRHQIEQGVAADFVIATEPTNFGIVHKAKGILWLRITARGTTAHGAYPWRADNAVWKMLPFLEAVRRAFPTPGEAAWLTTVNLSNIETGNNAYNKIPDICTVMLDVRFVPEDAADIVDRVTQLAPAGFDVEIVAHELPLFTAPDNAYVRALLTAARAHAGEAAVLYGAQGSSDARHYTAAGGAGVEFGPIGGGIGTDREWVSIASLTTYADILRAFLRKLI